MEEEIRWVRDGAHGRHPWPHRGSWWDCPGQALCDTKAFLYPRKPKNYGTARKPDVRFHFHEGIDLFGTNGRSIVKAVKEGVVVEALLRPRPHSGYSGYGRIIYIKGDDGRHYLYAHLSHLLVGERIRGDGTPEANLQRVEVGQEIAYVGRTQFDDHTFSERNEWEIADAEAAFEQRPFDVPPPFKRDRSTERTEVMGAHLHFEVSRSSYPKGDDQQRDPMGPAREIEYREDPVEVLKDLGPWGGAPVRPMYFPDGLRVTPDNTASLHAAVESRDRGGYFPIGKNNLWHSGVHLFESFGSEVVAPFQMRVVAARLDETDRDTARNGSANFLLLRFDLRQEVALRLAPPPPDADGRPPAVAGPPERRESVGEGGTNPEAYVLEVKRMLHAISRPATRDRPSASYYAPSDPEDMTRPTSSPELVAAIRDFQTDNRRRLGIRRVDGRVDVGLRTWNRLTELAPAAAARSTPSDESSATPTEPPRPPYPAPVYVLLMHLEPAPLDDARARLAPWLKRYRPAAPPDDPSERAEARYTMRAHVGPNHENRHEDVRWVSMRLQRFGWYTPVPDGAAPEAVPSAPAPAPSRSSGRRTRRTLPPLPPGLAEAILNFQNANFGSGDGVVSRGRQTYERLAKRPHEVVCNPPPPLIHPELLARLRESDPATGTTKVVTFEDMSLEVSSGEVLWTMGHGPNHRDVGCIHWEVFSEIPLMQTWQQIVDPDDDVAVDGLEHVVSAMESTSEQDDDLRLLSDGEVSAYYGTRAGSDLRQLQCRFTSPWSADEGALQQALERVGVAIPNNEVLQFRPFLWWPSAASVVPSDSKVWHYNPISFMFEYARALGSYNATLTVAVSLDGGPAASANVTVSEGTRVIQDGRIDARGSVTFHGITPGSYSIRVSGPIPEIGPPQFATTVDVRLVPADIVSMSVRLR